VVRSSLSLLAVRVTRHMVKARRMTTSPLPPQIIVDIKARRNDATERTNKRMNERVRQADGQTDGWTNERRCKRTYVRRPGEQNASADLVAYLWLRYPVVNKVPVKTKTRRNNEQMYPSLLVHKPV